MTALEVRDLLLRYEHEVLTEDRINEIVMAFQLDGKKPDFWLGQPIPEDD